MVNNDFHLTYVNNSPANSGCAHLRNFEYGLPSDMRADRSTPKRVREQMKHAFSFQLGGLEDHSYSNIRGSIDTWVKNFQPTLHVCRNGLVQNSYEQSTRVISIDEIAASNPQITFPIVGQNNQHHGRAHIYTLLKKLDPSERPDPIVDTTLANVENAMFGQVHVTYFQDHVNSAIAAQTLYNICSDFFIELPPAANDMLSLMLKLNVGEIDSNQAYFAATGIKPVELPKTKDGFVAKVIRFFNF